nr:type II toxin-antitoxin system RelE/ParE family toxin [Plastoroseomonas hellenica]
MTRQARLDLQAATRRIGADNLSAAYALNDAVLDAARRIGGNPAIGAHRLALADQRYRFWPLRRFSYLLVYTDQADPPRILRLVHMARDLPKLLADLPV